MFFIALFFLLSTVWGPDLAASSHSGPFGAGVEIPEADDFTLGYYQSGNLAWLARQFLWTALPLILLFAGLSARLRHFAFRLGRHWSLAAGVYFVLFYSALFILGLPIEYYGDFLRQRDYGLSEQSLWAWLGNVATTYLLVSLAGFSLMWVPYLLIKKSFGFWWVYTGLLVLPVSLLLVGATPLWVDPLFHEFRPLKERYDDTAILHLARQAGISEVQVFEVRKSRETTAMNAYVTGLGETRRIVLWDTLLDGLNESEVRSVVAHELGHYSLRHMERTLLLLTLLAIALFYGVHRGSQWLIERFRHRFGFSELADIASLPLIALLAHLLLLAASPGMLSYSRFLERQADEFALHLTGDGAARASTLIKLQERNLSHPRPGRLYLLFRASHPPLAERINRASR
jgi:STE24 endopeptidase